MSDEFSIEELRQRRDDIRQWLEDEAPYTVADQRHLDAHTPERAYWHYGYQAAVTDILDLITPTGHRSNSVDTSK